MIEVFKHEIVDGLSDLIKSKASVAYASAISPTSKMEKKLDWARSSLTDNEHLYNFHSVLVSTCVNANDDVFMPGPVWKARSSPSHKPVNENHAEKEIVGHITNVWAVDDSYNNLGDSLKEEELPNFYHLLIAQCIYKKWNDEKVQSHIDELIEKIEAGKLYVSMECYFKNIAYYITKEEEKKQYVLARNDETSFLTKHLRVYGGTGYYEECKVDRVLLDLSFSAVGIVENPANKYSVIFPESEKPPTSFSSAKKTERFNDVFKTEGVYITSRNNSESREIIMSDTDVKVLENKVAELTAALEASLKKNGELSDLATKAAQDKHEAELKKLNDKLEAVQKNDEVLMKKLEASTSESDSLKKDLVKVNEAKASLDEKFAKIEAEQLKLNRVAKLVDGGIAKDKATSTVDKFVRLNDEEFNVLADELIDAAKKSKEYNKNKNEDDDGEADANDVNADSKNLDEVDTDSGAALSTSNTDVDVNKLDGIRKSVAGLLSHFNKQRKSKKSK